ncbi:hypothetical protein TELCIR_13901 [Teladorsagia circumcincta]|uniref:CUB domain-containing protein n=1 Tax=Teladorsagia circumcincta TaxID=45464 RepID=A0A2G9U4N6_TELCI|nr:hypothetical protein TELCIR_13901 [Teladorsagia circumcincta]
MADFLIPETVQNAYVLVVTAEIDATKDHLSRDEPTKYIAPCTLSAMPPCMFYGSAVPPGCGQTLQASSNWATLTDMLDRQLSDGDYTECNYWIESPKGTIIELQIADYPWGYVSAGCSLAGFEIKSNKNQTVAGYSCCKPIFVNGFCYGYYCQPAEWHG